MVTQKPTPEEKLFAVIQGAAHKPLRVKNQSISLVTVGAELKARIGLIDLPRINQALMVVMAVLVVLCAFNPLLMRPKMKRIMDQAESQLAPFVISPPLQGLEPFQVYSEIMRIQDPFRLEVAEVSDTVTVPPIAMPTEDVQALLADFRLVGIAKDEYPRAMIEQVSQEFTSVLTVGEKIGRFTVKEILDDRVILQLGEQELELF